MIATWGEHQLLPREMIRALGDSGNTPWGAFDGDEMIGYVLGWSGVDPDEGLHTHSHMLATLPDRRHRGVGYALKLAQRAQCLDQGIPRVRWTFDPLLSRNAHFNLTKLGAVGGSVPAQLLRGDDRRAEPGRTERPADGPVGRGTDRSGARRMSAGFEVLGRGGDDPAAPSPTAVRPPEGSAALIRIPREYHDLRERDRGLAAGVARGDRGGLHRVLRRRLGRDRVHGGFRLRPDRGPHDARPRRRAPNRGHPARPAVPDELRRGDPQVVRAGPRDHRRRRGVGRMRGEPGSRAIRRSSTTARGSCSAGSWSRRCSRRVTSRPTTSIASWRACAATRWPRPR